MTLSSRWPRRLRRFALWSLAVLVSVALVAGLLGVWAVRRPLPDYDGEVPLAVLSAPVTVHRDAYGIPQIYAETIEDLFRAQGFVHAQDRFWEMDLRRHVTGGRLSELFGPSLVDTDAFLRTLGWHHVAAAEWELISPRSRGYLTAYAEGVNAWIDHTGGPAATGRKALQYRVLGLQRSGYEVAPWHPIDTLAWLKAMAWDLQANLPAESARARLLAAGLAPELIDELHPGYPYDRHAPIVEQGLVVAGEFDPTASAEAPPDDGADDDDRVPTEALVLHARAATALAEASARVPHLLGPAGAGLGSNSWVVAGHLTATGSPILVNDPHLGVQVPGIWHQLGLHCACGYQASGFTFSGMPGVVIGHNGRIAWGFTNLAHDVTDLYLERIDRNRYEVDGQWRDLELREETIRVAGGQDVTITVRLTHRGPVLSDLSGSFQEIADGDAFRGELLGGAAELGVSLAWTALTPGRTIESVFALNQASDWDEFRAAVSLFEVPAQNVIYADVDGNIGYQAPGRVPIRIEGDGRWMAPGWDSAYDWQGYVPFEQLPHLYNPESGFIVTANQAVIGPQYQPWLSGDWTYGYRSNRIHTLLTEATTGSRVTVSDMEQMMFDNHHGFAPVLVPALLAAANPRGDREQDAVDLLADWDFQQPAGGKDGTPEARSAAAAAYFNATWRHLLALLFDEIPEELAPGGGDRWFEVTRALLAAPDSPWWDRVDTTAVESRDEVLALALDEAYQELTTAQGDDPQQWRWGRMHTLYLREGAFGESGIPPVEAIFNRGPVETSGGGDIVNATAWHAAWGYGVVTAPSMRMVVDLSDVDSSRWVQATGNSGHAYHRHYTDQLDLWRTGDMLPWPWQRSTVEDMATHTMTLRPS